MEKECAGAAGSAAGAGAMGMSYNRWGWVVMVGVLRKDGEGKQGQVMIN